jgi:hypothetical protein
VAQHAIASEPEGDEQVEALLLSDVTVEGAVPFVSDRPQFPVLAR